MKNNEDKRSSLEAAKDLFPWEVWLSVAAVIIGAFFKIFLRGGLVWFIVMIAGVVAFVVFNTSAFKNWKKRAKRNRMTDEKKRTGYKGIIGTRLVSEAHLPLIDRPLGKPRYFIEGEAVARLKRVSETNKDTGEKSIVEKEVEIKSIPFRMEVGAETWEKLPEKTEVRLRAIRYLDLDGHEIGREWRKAAPYVKAVDPKAKANKSNSQTGAPAKAGANP